MDRSSDLQATHLAWTNKKILHTLETIQSCLKKENSADLERVQRSAVRNILGINFTNYEDALIKVD